MGADVGECVVVVVMGVAGSGKSALGLRLATRLGIDFIDADDHHSQTSREKMARGIGLEDEDRRPWLAALRVFVDEALSGNRRPFVLACSALKAAYRAALGVERPGVRLLHLEVDSATLARRLERRRGHFAGPALLTSQLTTLERPPSESWLPGERPLAELEEIALRRLTGAPETLRLEDPVIDS